MRMWLSLRRITLGLVVTISGFSVLLKPGAPTRAAEGAGAIPNPSADLISLGFKFEGAKTCNNAKCHGAPEAAAAPKPPGNEYNVWSDKDKHATAFDALAKPDLSKHPEYGKIGEKLKIADVTKSDRCLNCHALNAPANLQGEAFNVKEGVTCDECHGPSQKWREPHAEAGWTEKQRKAMDHATLLKTWGLFDTKAVVARAEKCTSCHLAIDPELITAGHPQPIFELDYYQELENKHWRDPGGYFDTKVWAGGQVVCLRDAMKQLADRATAGVSDALLKDSYDQAMGHYAVFKQAIAAKAVPADAAAMDQHATQLKAAMANPAAQKAAVATAAKALADAAATVAPAVARFEPDKKTALAILNGIASDASIAKDYGLHGVEQQAFAIYSLYNSYAKAENAGNRDDVNNVIAKLFEPIESKKVDPDQFAKTLQEVKAKLPQQ